MICCLGPTHTVCRLTMYSLSTLRPRQRIGSSKPVCAAVLACLLAGTVGGTASSSCHRDACVGGQKIPHNVETAIRNYPALQAPNSVRVQTRNRVVYLYGHVNNQVELETAERA